MSLKSTYTLQDGNKIPMLGFGTWKAANGEEATQSVLTALELGYRHIDTAHAYENEESVGKAIKQSGINRSELFVTTKLWNDSHTYDLAAKAIDESLLKLNLDYLDLYLIHWPNPVNYRNNWEEANAESWRAMEDAVKAGKINSLGVSNFHPHHLDALLKTVTIYPQVNQIQLNPSDMQPEVTLYNETHNILSEAYSPLGTGKIFSVPELKELANNYQKSISQVVLRWSLQHGWCPLPKSVHPECIEENTHVFDFELSSADMAIIDNLRDSIGLSRDPDTINH